MIYVNEHNKNRYGTQDSGRRYGSLPEEIASETKMLNGFVVFDKYKKRDYSKDTIERAINNLYTDRTGFEASMNDINIDFKDLEASEVETFVLDLNDALVRKFNRKMAIYIFPKVLIGDDDEETELWWNLRFHSLWDDEPLWMIPNPDNCEDTIFYLIADEKWVYVDPYSKRKKRPQE